MAANTLTGLIPTIYEALDVVSRELVGMIPAVAMDADASRAGLNQIIRSPVTPVLTSATIVPGPTTPDFGGQAIGTVDIAITKSKAVAFGFQGLEVLQLSNSPTVPPYGTVRRDLISQAIRTLVNEIEVDLAALARGSSRAFGTAGTAPFGTAADFTDLAQTLKILQDNGAPSTDLKFVLNTITSANLRGKQSQLFRVNEAGTSDLLRNGSIGRLMGFDIGESAGLASFTKGAGTLYTTTAAGFAIGTTVIPLITGSGTVLAGDVITFAGDLNKYVVTVGVAAPGSITIQGPGLRQAIPAAATALSTGNSYTPNVAFHKGAFQLVARAPALPAEGDVAVERIMIVDPLSGLPFEFSVYPQYRQVRYEVALSWGVATIAGRHAAMLLS